MTMKKKKKEKVEMSSAAAAAATPPPPPPITPRRSPRTLYPPPPTSSETPSPPPTLSPPKSSRKKRNEEENDHDTAPSKKKKESHSPIIFPITPLPSEEPKIKNPTKGRKDGHPNSSSPADKTPSCSIGEDKGAQNRPTRKRCRRSLSLSDKDQDRTTLKDKKKKRDCSGGRVYYRKISYDGSEFEVGDNVYVKRREDAESDADDPEIEECKVCFDVSGRSKTSMVMIECDDCLGAFHLKCARPKLKAVPEGDWTCQFCNAQKKGIAIELPMPPAGKRRSRTARERLLSSDLWAARIESVWREGADGTCWFKGRWYMIPEETKIGRQPHNLRRELFLTNDLADIEMESVLRHCYVFSPAEFAKADNEGDDVFLCEYKYDVMFHAFKRISEINTDEETDGDDSSDEDWESSKNLSLDSDDEEYDDGMVKELELLNSKSQARELAANTSKGQVIGLRKVGARNIPSHARCHKKTEIEKVKLKLMLGNLPKSPPCRQREVDEIISFVKGAMCGENCLGRCLYIHGVPGTGKTMSVVTAMKNLKSEVEAGNITPFRFVEINGLKLASPESIYGVIYEALTGSRIGWKKALHLLNETFSDLSKSSQETQPCVLLIDELDYLVTRNQSVLYNVLDWPTKACAKLIVIGISNTMDLPEKLLPRISSRMGMQRLCFSPYTYQQLQEIITVRLSGFKAFEKQAIEFASRKVAAVSGDARRALELCRRAAELTDYKIKQLLSSRLTKNRNGKELVGIAEVEAAIHEMFHAPHVQMIKSCSKFSKVMLVAIVHDQYKTGMVETTFEKVASIVYVLCTNNGEVPPGWELLFRIGCKLGECRLLLVEAGVRHPLLKLQLNCTCDDVTFALKDCPDLPWANKYLNR